jgi:hypothetical protein
MITTKCTWIGKEYGCRIFKDGRLILEGRCKNRIEIGPVFRDLLRTLDKDCFNSDDFTSSARRRISKKGNSIVNVKHIWF